MPRGSRDADWINLAQDAVQCRSLMTTVMNIGVALKAGSFLSNCTTVSFSRRTEFYGIVPIIIIIIMQVYIYIKLKKEENEGYNNTLKFCSPNQNNEIFLGKAMCAQALKCSGI